MNYSAWKRQNIDISEIKLDNLNPRVFVSKPTQKNIRQFLIDNFEVLSLAKSIYENNGLPPTENIVCVIENSNLVVIEGNRRTAACQLLRNPEIIPKEYEKQIPKSKDIQETLKKVEVVIAPSRDEAEPIITLRHTNPGIKSWSRLANVRRIMLRYNNGESINKISKVLNLSNSQVKNSVQFNSFINYVKDELDWDEDEKKVISNPLLEATKIDRFLPFSKEAKTILKLNFDANHYLCSSLSKKALNQALKDIFT
ncbi:ParB/Srx family N-terminal domain-containing protein, partial [Peribacillus frigoritolerans]